MKKVILALFVLGFGNFASDVSCSGSLISDSSWLFLDKICFGLFSRVGSMFCPEPPFVPNERVREARVRFDECVSVADVDNTGESLLAVVEAARAYQNEMSQQLLTRRPLVAADILRGDANLRHVIFCKNRAMSLFAVISKQATGHELGYWRGVVNNLGEKQFGRVDLVTLVECLGLPGSVADNYWRCRDKKCIQSANNSENQMESNLLDRDL